MSPPDFKDVFKELLDIEYDLRRLRRKHKLRNILKILGIGFFIYKNVPNEIEGSLYQRKTLLGNLSAGLSGYISSVRKGMESISTSNVYLAKSDETLWLNRINEAKEELTYLCSISALDNSQTVELLAELDGFQHFVRNYNSELEKKELRQKLLILKPEILKSEKEYNSLHFGQFYFSKRDLNDWKMKWAELVRKIGDIGAKARSDVDFRESVERVAGAYFNGESWLKSRNADFKAMEIQRFNDYFDKVEKNPLTKEQRNAIVTDEVNNLVVAGAGTGKTSTIVGKAGYIIRKGLAKPEEILLLSFNRKVSLELQERVDSQLGENLQVNTYHSFGLRVIAKATKTKPSVSDLAEDRVKFSRKIHEFIKKRMKDPNFAQLVNEYFLYYSKAYRSAFEFASFGQYVEYLKQVELRSLKRDKVKSFEECSIANFLFVNGIDFEYEKPYQVKTADINYRQYRPDFYLPKYKLYIEHFGVNRNGKTAPYVSQDEYTRQMQWKRDVHTQNKTTLIQTYSYEYKEGNLLKNLERKLREQGVTLSPLANEQVFSKLEDLGRITEFSMLVANFLNLYKSCGKSISQITETVDVNDTRTKTFLKIFSAIYDDYMTCLKEAGEIDFNDMLNDATEFILSGKYTSSFKYVLVDEFQDISYSRYRFLKALLDQNKSRLFAVGDDWQSIYRFTGSDISLMVDFEKNFDFSERCLLQESFRLNDKLCEFSTRFILQNPLQIRKNVRSTISKNGPSVSMIRGYTKVKVTEILEEISKISEKEQSVFIIGRYNRLKQEYLKDLSSKIPYLNVEYTTAHSSKGLEADYVVLIGMKGGIKGFPCQIVDDPLLDIVLAKEDTFSNAEERRLFYVALTRAKKHVYIIDDPAFVNSSFVSEILKGAYEVSSFGQPPKTVSCPVCDTGEIILKNGKYGSFYQCSNFPYCDYTPRECPECRKGFLRKEQITYRCSNDNCSFSPTICSSCGGYLVKRRSRNGGYFFGCVNYPTCKHIQQIDPSKEYRRRPYRRY